MRVIFTVQNYACNNFVCKLLVRFQFNADEWKVGQAPMHKIWGGSKCLNL